MSRPEVLRYLMKPVADLPIYMGNVDWGQFGGWAEGSMITTERVLVGRQRLTTDCLITCCLGAFPGPLPVPTVPSAGC